MTEVPKAHQPKGAEIAPTRAALSFDAQEYCHFLVETDWTDAQKCEFIETLWQIIVSFVDLGFDLHPVQQVIESPKTLELDSLDVLALSSNLKIPTTTDAEHGEFASSGRPDS